jgi:hypothetical protein
MVEAEKVTSCNYRTAACGNNPTILKRWAAVGTSMRLSPNLDYAPYITANKETWHFSFVLPTLNFLAFEPSE